MYINKNNINENISQMIKNCDYYKKYSAIMAKLVYNHIEGTYGDKIENIQVWGIGVAQSYDGDAYNATNEAYFKVIYQFTVKPATADASEVVVHMESKVKPFNHTVAMDTDKLLKKMVSAVASRIKKLECKLF